VSILGVVGSVADRLGEEPDRADRRLELVGDVGHEVAPDGLDAALPGAVLDQGQHQPRAERCDARGHRARRAVAAWEHQVGLPDLTVTAYLADELGELGGAQSLALDQTERESGGRGLDHLVVVVDDHGTAAQHREHGRHAGGEHGILGRGGLGLLPLAHAPGQHGTSGDDGPDERGQKGLRRGAHD